MYLSPKHRYLLSMELSGITEGTIAKWDKIEGAYRGRQYHNMEHIKNVLLRIEDLWAEFYNSDSNFNALMLAAIYHDVVYVPGSFYNELASGAYAALDLGRESLKNGLTTEVMRLIDATKHESYDPDADMAESILLDADLYELSTDRYEENSRKIREEMNCTKAQWVRGRYDWLVGFLARPRIYHIDDTGDLELKARQNMMDEIKGLDLESIIII